MIGSSVPAAEGVAVEDAGGVRRIVLDRAAKKNALTAAMYAALADAVESADAAGAGAIVFAANGPAFTAGNDLRDFLETPPQDEDAPVFRFMRAVVASPVPLAAAVRGAAIGIGTTLLLHLDLVYASPTALFRTPFTDLGLTAEFASSLLLPRTFGAARAGAALLLGEPLDADAALAAGLLTAIVPDDRLDDEALAKARALAAKPRAAVRATRALMRPDRGAILDAIRREAAVFTERLASPEAKAAFAAFLRPRTG